MPRKLDAIVEKLLRKDPAQRYASAGQLQRRSGQSRCSLHPLAGNVQRDESGHGRLLRSSLLLLAGGLAWWKYRPLLHRRRPHGRNRQLQGKWSNRTTKDSLILADFVNHTGDPVFDTTLNQALQIDLEQSPVISIVSPQHLLQSVKYLGKPEGTPVTPAIAREIGEREGIKAIITGTIANLGLNM